jgi:hypothetical protein
VRAGGHERLHGALAGGLAGFVGDFDQESGHGWLLKKIGLGPAEIIKGVRVFGKRSATLYR